MDLSLIQKDILITLISLYHKQSHAIKGEEIAEVLRRNPGTVRNQMQALKALSLVDGVPGPKGGYTPTEQAYRELNLTSYEQESDVPIAKDGKLVSGVNVSEIDFTTICHPDVCHAVVRLIGSVKLFNIGDMISIGPTPVNKLLVSGEIYGKDEDASLREAVHLFTFRHIHGAPVLRDDHLVGIVTLSDIARGIDDGKTLDAVVSEVMTTDVETAPANMKLFEVIGRFKEREIGRLIIVEGYKPVGILTQSDIIRVFPLL
jgi:predicted transcriptional regulator